MLILMIVCVLFLIAAGWPVSIGGFTPRWEYWAAAAFIAAFYLV